MVDTGADTAASQQKPGVRSSGPVGAGIIGALIASSCCVPPAAAVALGSSLATAAALGQLLAYRPLFVAVGLTLFGLALWMSLRKPMKSCVADSRRALIDRGLTTGVVSFVGIFLLVNQVVVPLLYNGRWLRWPF